MSGLLSIVATPIGNLDDLSPRAARALASADVIACEDTRVTRKLLSRVVVKAPLVAYHAANEESRAAELVARVARGDRVALVTDAGTPGISDPGHRLIAACRDAGVKVEVIPGPSAAIAALVSSGLPTARFVFEGFLPRTATARRRRLDQLKGEERTLVFFEAPHRLGASLGDMASIFGDREAAIARELTKIHEEVVRDSLSRLAARIGDAGVRGEITLVVAGAAEAEEAVFGDAALAGLVAERVAAGSSRKDAVAEVAALTGAPRRRVYQASIDQG